MFLATAQQQYIRRKRLYPSKQPSSYYPPLRNASSLAPDDDTVIDNTNTSIHDSDECPLVPELYHSLTALGRADAIVNSENHDELVTAIKVVVEQVRAATKAMCGDDKDEYTYFTTHGRILVIEEVDEYELLNGNYRGYKTKAGEFGGLNANFGSIRRRVHLFVEGKEGVYGANGLDVNYHYQIYQHELEKFLLDAHLKLKLNIKLAGVGGNIGTLTNAGLHELPPPNTDDMGDCIIYTGVNCPFPVAKTMTVNSEGEKVPSDEPSFFAVNGIGSTEIKDLVLPLDLQSMCRYLDKNCELDDGGLARRQTSSVGYGYQSLNCTDRRYDFFDMNTPSLSKKNDAKSPGFLVTDDTVTDSCTRLMPLMTRLCDGCSRLFDMKNYFNDDTRSELYANHIDPHNRAEAMVAAISSCFGCHIDGHNAKEDSYRLNLTAFEYVRNSNQSDPNKEDFFFRGNLGIYGRRICETTCGRRMGIDRLIHDLEKFIDEQPEEQVIYDGNLLKPISGDKEISYGEGGEGATAVGRTPHIDKFLFYSFYMRVLSDWINQRKIDGVPVSYPEVVEAVLTAVRWTTSPSLWAYVFRAVTSKEGFELKLPKGVTLPKGQEELLSKDVKKRRTRTLNRMKSYESPFPLSLQYVMASIQLTGGVAGGTCMRFQPHCALSNIDFAKEMKSLSQLRQLTTDLNLSTKEKKSESNIEVNDDDSLLKSAANIKTLSWNFVKDASKSLNRGGVLGLGDLLSHHYLALMALGGWIDFEHALNTRFSRGNGTANFLLQDYNLDIAANPNIIDSICTAECLQRFSPRQHPVSENLACKIGQASSVQSSATLRSSKGWWDTAWVDEGAVLFGCKDGRRCGITPDGISHPITSSWGVSMKKYKRDRRAQLDRFNLSVVGDNKCSSTKWTGGGFSLSSLFVEHVADVKNKHAKKALNRNVKAALEKGDVKKWASTTKSVVSDAKFLSPSRVWGQVPARSITKSVAIKKVTYDIISKLIYNRMISAAGLGALPTTGMRDHLLKNVEGGKGEVERIIQQMEKMTCLLNDLDSYGNDNEMDKGGSDMVKSVQQQLESHCADTSLASQSARRTRSMTKKEDASEDDDEDGDAKVEVDKYAIDDKHDAPHNNDDPLNGLLCKYECCGRVLPNANGCQALEETKSLKKVVDIKKEIYKFVKVSLSSPVHLPYSFLDRCLTFERPPSPDIFSKTNIDSEYDARNNPIKHHKIVFDGNRTPLWKCEITVGGKTYKSNDKAFQKSDKGRTDVPFCVGLHIRCDGDYHETSVHAELALLMCLMKKNQSNPEHAENVANCFLKFQNFCILIPNEGYAMNVNSHALQKEMEKLPLCCFLRYQSEIVVIDYEQLKFQADTKDDKVVTRSEGPPGSKRTLKSLDKLNYYEDPNSEEPNLLPLPVYRQKWYSMKNSRGHSYLVSYLGTAPTCMTFSINSRVRELKLMEDEWIQTVEPRDDDGNRTDKYWYSPVLRKRFRSNKEYEMFKGCIKACGGDEVKAYILFSEKKQNDKKGKTERVGGSAKLP